MLEVGRKLVGSLVGSWSEVFQSSRKLVGTWSELGRKLVGSLDDCWKLVGRWSEVWSEVGRKFGGVAEAP